VAKVVFKFNRWHHHVDYSNFKNNKLIKVVDTRSMPKINNYGMVLVNVPDEIVKYKKQKF
jgi:hypothetical protein